MHAVWRWMRGGTSLSASQCQAHRTSSKNVWWTCDWMSSGVKYSTLVKFSYENSCILPADVPFRLHGVTSCPGVGPGFLPPSFLSPSGSFSIDLLPQHAATCGGASPPPPASPASSPSLSPHVLWVSSPESSPPISWVQCPICELPFSAGEIEEHASTCGEVLQA